MGKKRLEFKNTWIVAGALATSVPAAVRAQVDTHADSVKNYPNIPMTPPDIDWDLYDYRVPFPDSNFVVPAPPHPENVASLKIGNHNLQRYTDIVALYALDKPLTIPDPTSVNVLGGADNPIHIYLDGKYPMLSNGQPLSAKDIFINNRAGTLSVKEPDGHMRTLLQWTVPASRHRRDPNNPRRRWLWDDLAPHIVIAQLGPHQIPEELNYAPASVPALRHHPLHHSNMYVGNDQVPEPDIKNVLENKGRTHIRPISELEDYLPKPIGQRYFDLPDPPCTPDIHDPKDLEYIDSAEWILWCHENGEKTAYNILNFNPHIDGYTKDHNLAVLNLAMTESAGGLQGDKLGPNHNIVNYAGYGGLGQFYLGNKRSWQGALADAGFQTSKGRWKSIQVGNETVQDKASYLNSWRAQVYCILAFTESNQKLLRNLYERHSHRFEKNGAKPSFCGFNYAAHLTGAGMAKRLLEHGRPRRDGSGTSNLYYTWKFGAIPNENFFQGHVYIPKNLAELEYKDHVENFLKETYKPKQLTAEVEPIEHKPLERAGFDIKKPSYTDRIKPVPAVINEPPKKGFIHKIFKPNNHSRGH